MTAEPTLPGGPRVLVVEDCADTRETLVYLLALCGYQARGAACGAEGLRLAQSWRPDAVVADISLPGLDGWELASRLRAALGSSVRLVAVSGHAQPRHHQRSLEAGFDHHLAKPAEPRALFRLLGKAG